MLVLDGPNGLGVDEVGGTEVRDVRRGRERLVGGVGRLGTRTTGQSARKISDSASGVIKPLESQNGIERPNQGRALGRVVVEVEQSEKPA